MLSRTPDRGAHWSVRRSPTPPQGAPAHCVGPISVEPGHSLRTVAQSRCSNNVRHRKQLWLAFLARRGDRLRTITRTIAPPSGSADALHDSAGAFALRTGLLAEPAGAVAPPADILASPRSPRRRFVAGCGVGRVAIGGAHWRLSCRAWSRCDCTIGTAAAAAAVSAGASPLRA